ncbi:MAG: polyketide synthase, partial [Proteobacteria bacterium]|nr:polyketide synthase [Pseudomonadota bacterium]
MQRIAVIGISCLFPGAETPEQFMRNLYDHRDTTSPPSKKQMGVDPEIFFHPQKGETDKYYSVRGGYIRDFSFDPVGYDLPAEFLNALDDVYKWSLYVSRAALVDSRYLGDKKALAKCGILLGNLSFPTKSSNRMCLPIYHQAVENSTAELLGNRSLKLADPPPTDDTAFTNSRISGYPAALIARALSLAGINFALDAACASSLYAVKLACDYLRTGKADLMLAGAVSAGDPFFVNQGFSTFTAYSDKDESRPLDSKSSGLVSGEGAGMFVLKRYEDALKDGDRIHATIRGIGLSNDGRGRSVLSTNPKGQIVAYERAYADSEIKPEKTLYIECHATGTSVGDPDELESLDTFFGRYGAKPLVGSVKANFGHLLTASGMASMIKVVLGMSKGEIPATIKLVDPLSSPNQVIAADQVVSANTPWPDPSPVKQAAVNAFGFGGTNAHLIFEREDHPAAPSKTADDVSSGGTGKSGDREASVAIVGMDACFGSHEGLDAFDYCTYAKLQNSTALPPKRWKGIEDQTDLLESYGFEKGKPPWGGYIEDFDLD